ncbi:MAG: SCP2 sterol-binding domain-containing protein [Ardenticatenaceae bacterium]|nr:SCP2 sterol-binding domain-containing protein [Ardenticatenaceae bacterium]
MIYTENFPIQFDPVANPDAVVMDQNVRFTVLTSRLIRLEYSPTAVFNDQPSQVFWYRRQPVPEFSTRYSEDGLELETEHLLLRYRRGEAGFTAEGLTISLKGGNGRYSFGQPNPTNLHGTARTLDEVDGGIQLEPGLLARNGWAVVDDSRTLLFNDKGWLEPRNAPGSVDSYFFGYGHDYQQCLVDYQKLAGGVPLLPRWVLGNWWSRFWPYSEEELLGLMDEFQANGVPLSVCIVDIDWHLRQTGNTSSGWTGYTWNRDLFPDPEAFMAALHERGLKTALNLHPAEGVHPHEEQYEALAERMGIDPATKQPVPFDIVDPDYAQAYFELLHHPDEARGVDFWWIDWQQGELSKMPGLDPLWWLNHLHFYDLARDGEKRPFVFSRWGGLGNHRYPIGFSGDSVVTWESLAFQPYFTATAANVGYGWWSHDIGGHMGGIEEAELYTRWVQYGVLSPIFRLHCTNNPFHERRPWGYDAETFRLTKHAMRLRHALIPYLYTLSWQNQENGRLPITPLYHDYPNSEQAYHCPDQYMFGSELLAAPHITPRHAETGMSRQVVWLPEGQWHHFFTGRSYSGDRFHPLYGGLDDIPLFAKPGAIVPLGPMVEWGGVDNPEALEIHLFPGGDNRFELYEDDGQSGYSLLPLRQSWTATKWQVNIDRVRGTAGHLPHERALTLCFRGVRPDVRLRLLMNGQIVQAHTEYDAETVTLRLSGLTLTPHSSLTAVLTTDQPTLLANRDYRQEMLQQMLWAFRLDSWQKQRLNNQLPDLLQNPALLASYELALTPAQMQAVAEVVTGAGVLSARQRDTGRPFTILWNNQQREDVGYRLSAQGITGDGVVQKGSLPKFVVLTDEDNLTVWRTGDGLAETFASADDWFAKLPQRFRGTAVGNLEAVVQFHLTGQTRYLHIKEGQLTVADGQHPQPTITLTAQSRDFLDMVNGDAQPIELFRAQRLQVGGNFILIGPIMNALGTMPRNRFQASPWKLTVSYQDWLALTITQ